MTYFYNSTFKASYFLVNTYSERLFYIYCTIFTQVYIFHNSIPFSRSEGLRGSSTIVLVQPLIRVTVSKGLKGQVLMTPPQPQPPRGQKIFCLSMLENSECANTQMIPPPIQMIINLHFSQVNIEVIASSRGPREYSVVEYK